MQLDPMKPSLKAPGSMLLILRYDGPVSNFAFKFILHRYTEAVAALRDMLRFVVIETASGYILGLVNYAPPVQMSMCDWQGLTPVHFSAQPKPFLNQKHTLHTP